MASGSVRERAPKGVTVIWNKQEKFIINLFYTNVGGFIIARSFLHIHQLGTCGPCPLLPLHQNFSPQSVWNSIEGKLLIHINSSSLIHKVKCFSLATIKQKQQNKMRTKCPKIRNETNSYNLYSYSPFQTAEYK